MGFATRFETNAFFSLSRVTARDEDLAQLSLVLEGPSNSPFHSCAYRTQSAWDR